jgi:glycosyltransferase involved in cell wall biosynthesis
VVSPFEHGGGAEYQISLLIDALAATARYDIHYLTHFVDGRERTRQYQISQTGSGRGIPRFGYLMDGPALYRRLREIAPSAIYQRVACAYTGICAAYARRCATPMIWHVAHDTDVEPLVLDPGRNFVRVHLERWAVNYGARRATKIVVQTERQALLLQQNFSRHADAVVSNFHPPAQETIDKSGPVSVVWVANLKPWKQPEVFVRLAAALNDCRGVKFMMVGAPGGSGAWQESLMADIAATPNIEYLGKKTHAEVNELLAHASVFVNTSIHEGFPNTFIQSWLREVAVVSLNVDPDDVLQRQQVGILARTEAALHQAVRGLIESAELRSGYAARGRQHAAVRHSLRNAQELVRLIEGCSGSRQ